MKVIVLNGSPRKQGNTAAFIPGSYAADNGTEQYLSHTYRKKCMYVKS